MAKVVGTREELAAYASQTRRDWADFRHEVPGRDRRTQGRPARVRAGRRARADRGPGDHLRRQAQATAKTAVKATDA